MKPVVIIPCYKESLDINEAACLRHGLHVLGSHDVRAFLPEGMTPPPEFRDMALERFPARFFVDVQGYNDLLLSPEFYERFAAWDYMLIYQLDAWVFRDELLQWCARGYDYIGAPWGNPDFLKRWRADKRLPAVSRWPRLARLFYGYDFRAGNGGFSLRRTETFRRILQRFPSASTGWRKNEDLFWSFRARTLDRRFRVASESDAMYFAIETEPRGYLARMKGRLPFGCHAWKKYDADFWDEHISAENAPAL